MTLTSGRARPRSREVVHEPKGEDFAPELALDHLVSAPEGLTRRADVDVPVKVPTDATTGIIQIGEGEWFR